MNRKKISILMTIVLFAMVLTACGKKNAGSDDLNENGVGNSTTIEEETDEQKEADSAQNDPVLAENDPAARYYGMENLIVKENFTGGVVVDDPYCYFEIESMEMTESAFVIHYFLEVDSRGYRSFCDIENITINGVKLDDDSMEDHIVSYYEYESEDYNSEPVLTSEFSEKERDRPARMEIARAPMEAIGIHDVTSLWMKFEAGYKGTSSIHTDQNHDIALYPGARDDTPLVFSPTEQTQLVADDEYLYIALVGGNLRYSDEDGDVTGGLLYCIGWPKKPETVFFSLITDDDREKCLLSSEMFGDLSMAPTLFISRWNSGSQHYSLDDLADMQVIFKEKPMEKETVEANLTLNIAFE